MSCKMSVCALVASTVNGQVGTTTTTPPTSTTPTPPPSPQVRIYEDFDRMSAKEVYYNEAGKKVTVKLLHFPDVLPEDIAKLRFDDEDDPNADADVDDDDGVDSDADRAAGSKSPAKTSADSEDGGSEAEAPVQDANCNATAAAGTGGGNSSGGGGGGATKKIFRRKLSGNNMQARKCSLAFAQAHGIKQRAEKKLSMPTISITANPGEHVSLSAGRKLSQQHSLPLMMMSTPPRRSHSPLGQSLCPGYIQYSKSLLEVPMPRDYGYASSDDLSSEWDSDVSTSAASGTTGTGSGAAGASTASGTKKVRRRWLPCYVLLNVDQSTLFGVIRAYPALSAVIRNYSEFSNIQISVSQIKDSPIVPPSSQMCLSAVIRLHINDCIP